MFKVRLDIKGTYEGVKLRTILRNLDLKVAGEGFPELGCAGCWVTDGLILT
jgi:hypothetical protein